MQQTNPFDQFDAPAPTPVAPGGMPGIIRGRPKAPDPIAMERLSLDYRAEERNAARDARDAQNDALTNRVTELTIQDKERAAREDQIATQKRNTLRGEEGLAAGRVLTAIDRARGKLNAWSTGTPGQALQGWGGTDARDLAAQLQTIKGNLGFDRLQQMRDMSPTGGALGQVAVQELEALQSTVASLDQAQSADELSKGLDEIERMYKGILARQNFGVAKESEQAEPGRRNEGALQFNDQAPEASGAPTLPPEIDAAFALYAQNNPDATPEQLDAFVKSIGGAGLANMDEIAAYRAKGGRGVGAPKIDPAQTAAYEAKLREENARVEASNPRSDLGVVGAQGYTAGLSDEIAGIGGMVGAALSGRSAGDGYTVSRDAERLRIREARDASGGLGVAAEIGGGLMLPIGGVARAGALAPLAARITSGARVGAASGALSGFGYGEGVNSVPSALAGAVVGGGAGGALTAAIPMVANAASRAINSPSRVAARITRADQMSIANRAATAAGEERIPVSRGILDPMVRNDVTALEVRPGSNAPIRQGLERTANAINARVNDLGRGGSADVFNSGETVQQAGRRFITRSREVVGKLYDRAEAMAGDTQVLPVKAATAIRRNMDELQESGAELNSGMLAYLNDLKAVIGRDGGMTVSTLRNLRTNVRGQISERNLTATDAERRAMQILDAASDDIADTLGRANPEAARAYGRADKAFRAKQQYIKDVVQKFVGPRNSPISAEAAMRKMEAFAKEGGDSRRLAEMMRSLSPEESRDIAATFAADLGRTSDGAFSPGMLVTQAEKLSDRAKQTIFGPAGARSLDNLVRVAREYKQTTGNLNNSRTGVATYRNWLTGAMGLVGGGSGAVAGAGLTGAAITAVAAGKIAQVGVDALDARAARALMSPDITRWLATAPRTTDPTIINAHYRRLSSIAARQPELAGAIEVIQARITDAARSMPARSTAEGSGPNAGDDVRQ